MTRSEAMGLAGIDCVLIGDKLTVYAPFLGSCSLSFWYADHCALPGLWYAPLPFHYHAL